MPEVIGFDTETHLIEPGRLAPPLVCLSVSSESGRELFDKFEAPAVFTELLHGATWFQYLLVGHNVAYDLAVFMVNYPETTSSIFAALDADGVTDTKIRATLVAIADGRLDYDPAIGAPPYFSLAECVKRQFGVDMSGTEGEDFLRLCYAELDGVPLDCWPTDASAYALDDAQWTRQIYEHTASNPRTVPETGQPLVTTDGHVIDEFNQTRAAFALHLMAVSGLRADPGAVANLKIEIEELVNEGIALATAAGFLRPNGTKNMVAMRALVEAAYARKGEEPPRTPKGQVQTSEEALLKSEDPALVAYSETLKAQNFNSKFLPILEAAAVAPIHPSWNPLVETGRVSCAKPPMQQPPRERKCPLCRGHKKDASGTRCEKCEGTGKADVGFRECWLPDPGCVWCSVDFSTVELCALSQVQLWQFGYSPMAEAINSGIDLHVDFAGVMLGDLPYDVALLLYESGDPEITEARQVAKEANFGFPGGMGAKKFALRMGLRGFAMTEDRAKEVRDRWLQRWSMRPYFQWISDLSFAGEFTYLQWVSKRHRGGCNYMSGANTGFQGLVADGAKAALYEVTKRCYDPLAGSGLLGCRPKIQMHDEIITSMPKRTAGWQAAEQAEVMRQTMQRYIPDVKIKCDVALMERWTKGAKAVHDPDTGLLVPWEYAADVKRRTGIFALPLDERNRLLGRGE